MQELKVSLKYVADEEYQAQNESGNVLNIDMLAKDEKKAFSPTQLLLAGITSCAAVDLVSMIKKRRKTLVDLTSEVTGKRREEQPRRFTDIHVHYKIVSPDAQLEEVEKLVDLAVEKYCSVAASVSKEIKLTHSVEVVKP